MWCASLCLCHCLTLPPLPSYTHTHEVRAYRSMCGLPAAMHGANNARVWERGGRKRGLRLLWFQQLPSTPSPPQLIHYLSCCNINPTNSTPLSDQAIGRCHFSGQKPVCCFNRRGRGAVQCGSGEVCGSSKMEGQDDGMMRIGKRCYVSNLAWRTSW